jgi:hypothetical protein
MHEHKLIVIYVKKIEVACEARCEDEPSLVLVLLDDVEPCDKEDKDRVVAEASAELEDWKPDVAKDISTTKVVIKVSVLMRVWHSLSLTN